jgi:hypothetical protein
VRHRTSGLTITPKRWPSGLSRLWLSASRRRRAGTLCFVYAHLSHERAPVHVTNATLNMNAKCRLQSKSFFLLTKDTSLCYSGNSPSRVICRMTTGQSQTTPALRAPLRTQDLSPGQRSLVALMHEHQFGRVENMSILAGNPVIDQNLKVVRVACLGGENDPLELTNAQDSS